VFASTAVPGHRLTLGRAGYTVDGLSGAGTGAGWDRVAVAVVGPGEQWIELLLTDATTARFAAADWSARRGDAVTAVRAHLSPSTPLRFVRETVPAGAAPGRYPLDRQGRTRMGLVLVVAAGFALTALLFATLLIQDGGNNALVTTTAVLAAIAGGLARTAWRTLAEAVPARGPPRGGPRPGSASTVLCPRPAPRCSRASPPPYWSRRCCWSWPPTPRLPDWCPR